MINCHNGPKPSVGLSLFTFQPTQHVILRFHANLGHVVDILNKPFNLMIVSEMFPDFQRDPHLQHDIVRT